MRTDRFFVQTTIAPGELLITDPTLVHQLKTVLRMEPGSALSLFNGDGSEWHGTIRDIKHDKCLVAIEGQLKRQTEPERAVHAGISILKKEYFELVAQKLVETGIASITPVISHRTIKTNVDRERIRKIIIEAAEQSGRLYLPELTEAVSVEDFIEHRRNVVVFHMDGEPVKKMKLGSDVSFMVGPEGGWSIDELAFFAKRNTPLLSLGRTVLRGETAAIVGAHRLIWE